MEYGPTLPFSDELHGQKYRCEGESFRDAMNRVASALSDSEDHYQSFREILLNMRFMPAGRIQTAIGSTKNVTPYNCYVSGVIEDSFIEGSGSIMRRAEEAAQTMRMGGGIGYDFSTLRPRGAMIKKLQSRSSGPVTFMGIYDAVCRCVASSGHRRGAQMGVLRVDHPDIEEFIYAKHNETALTGFNVSVAVTNAFMEALHAKRPFPLKFNGETYREVDPVELWENIMRSTWDWAEPGVLFIDTINAMNNLYYCEKIAATNPCGEQPLPPHGACLLGSFNLVNYLTSSAGSWSFDFDQFTHDIPLVVRAMDLVVDKAIYPLYEQEKEAKSKRRMGLGVTGVANALEAMGHPYGSPKYLEVQEHILYTLNENAYLASALLAKEKGAFPLYDAERYLAGKFIKNALSPEVQDYILQYGIRNSHLTSIAPTGTISLCADNISSGIEPVFAYNFARTVIEFEGPRTETIDDYGVRVLGVHGRRASEVTPQEHLAVLSSAFKYVDSSVSKTCNVPNTTEWKDFKAIYEQAWENGCKGCTTFTTGGKRGGILVETEAPAEPEQACYIDPETGRRECS